MNFLIDLDGVLADFVGGVMKLFGKTDLLDSWPAAEYNISKVLGIPNDEIWKAIDSRPSFWVRLEPIPDGFELYYRLKSMGTVVICTSPSRDPGCASGKVSWMQKHLGSGFRDYIITPHKHLFAKPGNVLIDDCDANCDAFEKAGGEVYMFPQPWNTSCGITGSKASHIIDEMNQSHNDIKTDFMKISSRIHPEHPVKLVFMLVKMDDGTYTIDRFVVCRRDKVGFAPDIFEAEKTKGFVGWLFEKDHQVFPVRSKLLLKQSTHSGPGFMPHNTYEVESRISRKIYQYRVSQETIEELRRAYGDQTQLLASEIMYVIECK